MRIALVTTSFLPRVGGAEFAIHHLAQEWCRQGHEVTVINGSTDRAVQPGALYSVRLYRVLRGTTRFGYHRFPFSWYETRQISRHLADFRPDFISAHYGYPVAIWLSRLRPVPRFTITCHGPALDETPEGPRRRYGVEALLAGSLNHAAGVVAISSFARRVLEKIGVEPARILDIPNGADLERFRKQISGFDLRDRLGLPADSLVVLSVGRETWEKAYDKAIQAFAGVAAQTTGTYYVILGRQTARWRPLAQELGIADRVVFCEGFYDDELVGAYQQADIFFMPSIQELCPLVVPEAMAAGLPEVVTNVGGSQDMVQSGHNGLVVEPGNIEEMSAALLTLATDAAARQRMADASRERSELYGWERISRMHLEPAEFS